MDATGTDRPAHRRRWSTGIGAALGAAALGLFAYGISLTWFVVALRHLGTARTGACYSVAPFFGATLSVLWLGESVTPALLAAGALMALGVWLHLSERHLHAHTHEALEHEHAHTHDEPHGSGAYRSRRTGVRKLIRQGQWG